MDLTQRTEAMDEHGDTTSDTDRARAALDLASGRTLASERDRHVHALATAGFGLLIGVYAAVTRADALEDLTGVLAGGYVVIALLIVAWQRRAAGTVPLRSRRTSGIGTVCTLVALVVGLGVVNTIYRGSGETLLALALFGLWVAAPMLVAGALIARPRR